MLQEHLLSLPAEQYAGIQDRSRATWGSKSRATGICQAAYSRRGIRVAILPGFIREFRRRLARPRCAVRPRGLKRITSENVREFALQSRQECKLVLAREMFPAEEVVARVHRHVKRTAGMHVASTTTSCRMKPTD